MNAHNPDGEEIDRLKAEVVRLKVDLQERPESIVIKNLRYDLDNQTQRFDFATQAGQIGLAELDVATSKVVTDARFSAQGGFEPTGSIDFQEYINRVHPDDTQRFVETIQTALEQREQYDFFYRYILPSGEERWIRTCGRGYVTGHGIEKVVGLTIDITDQKVAEQARELLIQEMSHRVKNLFAVISALLQSAPKESNETKKFAQAFISRIEALGETYDLAQQAANTLTAEFQDLLNRVISPHRLEQTLTITGPQVLIRNDHLTTLTLMLHEMITNAVKYGAFSCEDGKLEIEWNLSEDRNVNLSWREYSPNFVPPQREPGFGSQLIEIGALQLSATYEATFSKDGLQANLSFPMQ